MVPVVNGKVTTMIPITNHYCVERSAYRIRDPQQCPNMMCVER